MKALVIDCETTGLVFNHLLPLDRQAEVIEFYGCFVDLETGEQLNECYELIRPKHGLTEESIASNNITADMLKDAPLFPSVADKIRSTLEAAPLIIAHNVSFDSEILDIEFERLGQRVNWPRRLCTVEQTVHLKGIRMSQSVLHSFLFGEPHKEAHRAKSDVTALTRICIELYKRGEL